jgi:hypothetical protein
MKSMSRQVNGHSAAGTIVAMSTILMMSMIGCVTMPVESDYSPRLSSRTVTVEQQIQSLGIEAPILVLDYLDTRAAQAKADAKPDDNYLSTEAALYKDDPHHVWTQKFYKYRLASKTLAQYLSDALFFDMQRMRLPVTRASEETRAFSGAFEGKNYDQRFVLGLEVLRFRPGYKPGFVNVTPFYMYTVRVRLWDSDAEQVVLDETIDKKIEDLPVPGITFADMLDKLMNDHLAEVNFVIIEKIAVSLSKRDLTQ